VNKKLKKGLSAFAIVATLVPTMVFASEEPPMDGPGEWDGLLNSEYGVYSSRWVSTRQVNSGGGDLRVCVSGVNSGNTVTVNVYEADVAANDTVKTGLTFTSATKTCSANIDVEKYVDGGYAEIFLQLKGKDESDTVRVYIDD
jgi:hypothetical protein